MHLLLDAYLLISFISRTFNSFDDVHVDRVNVNQRFQNRECLALDHEIDRVIDIVNSFNLRDLSSLV